MRILIPIDNSSCCKKTIEWASDFFNTDCNTFHILTIIDIAPDIPIIDLDIQEANKLIESTKKTIMDKGFQIEKASYMVGEPANAIIEYADEEEIDIIMIGSHGKQGIAKFIMGSVSSAVFKHASQPVLVIKNHDKVLHPQNIANGHSLSHTML